MHWSRPEESGNRTSYIKAREPMLRNKDKLTDIQIDKLQNNYGTAKYQRLEIWLA